MNAMRMMIAIVWLTGLLLGMAQASDADDFVAASRSQQTAMLTRWAATPEPARLPLLKALQQENLYTDSQKKAFTRIDGEMVARRGKERRRNDQSRATDQPAARVNRHGAGDASACQ